MASNKAIGKKAVHDQWTAFFSSCAQAAVSSWRSEKAQPANEVEGPLIQITHAEQPLFYHVPMASRLQRFMLRSINLWPPFLAAGIHVRWGSDMRSADVEMRMHFWNRNYVGTHYGGSLYSMTDPFYMLMLMENLGRDYIVWDKAASIRFRKPGKGTVRAEFRLTQEQLDDIRGTLTRQEKYEPVFRVEVKDREGTVVAEVEKVLHIRRKPSPERTAPAAV